MKVIKNSNENVNNNSYDINNAEILKKSLTKRQAEILDFIKKFIAKNGYSPSFREIGEGMDISSSATIHSHLNNLVEKGWIKKGNYKFRTIEIVGENEYYNKNHKVYNIPVINENNDFSKINLNKNNYVLLSSKLFNINSNSFIVKVIKDGLFNKEDLLVVKKLNKYNDSDIIVYVEDNKIKIDYYKNNIQNICGKVINVIKTI